MKNVYDVTNEFENKIAEYTGAPYAICVDNASNAIFLSLMYEQVSGKTITIPNRTYPSVPCEVLHAGATIKWKKIKGKTLKGAYQLEGSNVWDAALSFTYNMYKPNTHMCLSFTGPYKHFKLSKGGCIITDDHDAYLWFKRARYSGRRECSYHDDNFDMLGWNFYMMPELAARGLLLMGQFWNGEQPVINEDKEMPYPDLSKFPIFNKKTTESIG
jgi:dTDP-4-amino-4,6-dideoxygalactose transaminase|tara:strand:- start:4879 stop:5523 length:645 start_codon:yes stop_codon:yes gene_type:complete